ncbi:MAG: DUF4382 domain-containing protein [Candidatus Marinimicrobia bacterium]|nr:DUF4382 domain-containing protein [Candidatus Neomarinimicrobiota bacterium]
MMKNYFGFMILGFVLVLALNKCENSENTDTATGSLLIQAFDAPFEGNVQHIYLNITEVSVHKAVADSSADSSATWIVLSELDTTIDFLDLVNGEMAALIEEDLEVGQYSQLRLMLGDSSAIVVDGTSYSLKVPSGSESGVKLNLGFFINPDEIIEIYLDFDAARSINKHPVQDKYSLQPTFRVFKSVLSGTIAGAVYDTTGAGMEDIVIQAISNGDTVSTLSSESGLYQLILLEGAYTLEADGFELMADTSYSAISLAAGDHLSDYDFVME